MIWQWIRRDIRKSKLTGATTIAFVLIASLFLSTAASVSVHLASSIQTLFAEAKTPHFLQMHTGDVNKPRLEEFVANHPSIESYQVADFLNIDGSLIRMGDRSLAHSVQDNGFSIQNESFDFLLNVDGTRMQPKPGEVYVPLYYHFAENIRVGDTLEVAGHPLRVAGYVRDSQMNAALVSSKRFVVHADDLAKLMPEGRMERLIEFRYNDLSRAGEVETAYVNAGLEANGPPAITHRMFAIINFMTEGLMVAVLALISFFVIAIAMLCVRFAVLAGIEEDTREIGVLKAIGMSNRSIGRLYTSKYVFLAGMAAAAGFLLSLWLQRPFLRSVELYMGKSNAAASGVLVGLLAAAVVFGFVFLYIRLLLRRFRAVTPAQALRAGAADVPKRLPRRLQLQNSPLRPNAFLGWREIASSPKLYSTMLFVLILSFFLLLVPINMANTIADRGFVRYMGLGEYDIRFDISQQDDVKETALHLHEVVSKDPAVSKSALLLGRLLDVRTDSGAQEKIRVEFGDHDAFPVRYQSGRAPKADNEISLSALNASEWEKQVGDPLVVTADGDPKTLIVSGIYTDITNGGKTAKAVFPSETGKTAWATIPLTLAPDADLKTVTERYRAIAPYAKISDVDAYMEQTFGSMQQAIRQVVIVSGVAAGVIAFMLSLLFMRMIHYKNLRATAVLKAIGFSITDIRKQHMGRAVWIFLISAPLGIVLANTIGAQMGASLLSLFGAGGVRFLSDPLVNVVWIPIGIGIAVVLASFASLENLKTVSVAGMIKE